MERYFCRDKKDYCDKDLACRGCEFAKGSGVINGVYVEDVLSTLFGDNYNLDRLKELVKADREGRCAVLPVKIGDIVYTNISVLGDRYRNAERPYPVKVIFVGIGEGSVYFNVEYDNGRIFPFEGRNIGKTIFFTREEAETALKAMKARKNDG